MPTVRRQAWAFALHLGCLFLSRFRLHNHCRFNTKNFAESLSTSDFQKHYRPHDLQEHIWTVSRFKLPSSENCSLQVICHLATELLRYVPYRRDRPGLLSKCLIRLIIPTSSELTYTPYVYTGYIYTLNLQVHRSVRNSLLHSIFNKVPLLKANRGTRGGRRAFANF
jgi:hypothetical protein